MKVRLVMAAIAAISSVTCLGGLFDNALKAVSDTAKAVTVSPGETRAEAERARQKALLEESERIRAEDRKKIEAEEESERARLKAVQEESERKESERRKKTEKEEKEHRQQRERAQAERKAKWEAAARASKAKEEREERERRQKEQENCRERIVRACMFAKRGDTGSVYVDETLKQAFKGSVQYATNSIIQTHIPIYKEITSGTSFGYVIDKGYLPGGTTRMKASPFVVPNANYQGCIFDMGQGLGLCCTVSKIEEKIAGGFSYGVG